MTPPYGYPVSQSVDKFSVLGLYLYRKKTKLADRPQTNHRRIAKSLGTQASSLREGCGTAFAQVGCLRTHWQAGSLRSQEKSDFAILQKQIRNRRKTG